jgi:hypothetical protein
MLLLQVIEHVKYPHYHFLAFISFFSSNFLTISFHYLLWNLLNKRIKLGYVLFYTQTNLNQE